MVITMNRVNRLVIIVVVMGLTACVSIDPYTQPSTATQPSAPVTEASGQPNEKEVAPEPTAKPKDISEVAAAPAVVSDLLAKAGKQKRQGDLNGATATVERAIRIAPRYPVSYYRLAELKFDANDFSNAKSLAQKAISLGASGTLKISAQELVVISDNYIAQGL
jgi:cytochrome c-type biogenesis protein CcmH/NrfG